MRAMDTFDCLRGGIAVAHREKYDDELEIFPGMSFHDCYTKCREAFLVNSDATLRAQLTEFRDHKLIRSKKVRHFEWIHLLSFSS